MHPHAGRGASVPAQPGCCPRWPRHCGAARHGRLGARRGSGEAATQSPRMTAGLSPRKTASEGVESQTSQTSPAAFQGHQGRKFGPGCAGRASAASPRQIARALGEAETWERKPLLLPEPRSRRGGDSPRAPPARPLEGPASVHLVHTGRPRAPVPFGKPWGLFPFHNSLGSSTSPVTLLPEDPAGLAGPGCCGRSTLHHCGVASPRSQSCGFGPPPQTRPAGRDLRAPRPPPAGEFP